MSSETKQLPSPTKWHDRRTFRRIPIGSLLAALPLFGMLPMLVFAVVLLFVQWQSRQDDSRRELQQTARALAVAVERELSASAWQLKLVANLPLLADDSLDQFHRYLRQILDERSEWASLALLEPSGRQVLDTAVPLGAPLPEPDDLPYHEVLESGDAVVSSVYRSGLSGEPAIAVLVPVERDGRVRWLLRAQLSTLHLSEILKAPLARSDVFSVITDSTGAIVARSLNPERFVGQLTAPGYERAVEESPRGVIRTQALEGNEVLVAWEPVVNGWTAGIAVPAEAYDLPLRRLMLTMSAVGAVLLAAALVAAVWLSRGIARAVNTAASDAGRLVEEQQVPQRRSRIAELGSLFDAQHRTSLKLAKIGDERNRATEELREAVQRRDHFLAMLGHELRNPLAPLTNAHHLLRRSQALGERDRTMLGMAERQTRQLTRLVDDLLDVSRLASGKIRLQAAPVSMRDTVHEVAEAVRPQVESASQRLRVDVPDEPVPVVADKARISQVLHNLLGNALKFNRTGGTIGIELETSGDDAVVTVTDEGIGIDPPHLTELFEPFNQIDPGIERANGGLGLGLALVRQLVELHGGTVEAASAGRGTGARFTIRLPRVPHPTTARAPARRPEA